MGDISCSQSKHHQLAVESFPYFVSVNSPSFVDRKREKMIAWCRENAGDTRAGYTYNYNLGFYTEGDWTHWEFDGTVVFYFCESPVAVAFKMAFG